MHAFVKWQPSEFVVTSEKECRPVNNAMGKTLTHTQTRIACCTLFQTDFSSFSLRPHRRSTVLPSDYYFFSLFVGLHHSHIKKNGFSFSLQRRTNNQHSQPKRTVQFHFMSHHILFVYIILFVGFSARINYLMWTQTSFEYTEMSCVVKPNFDMHLILLN